MTILVTGGAGFIGSNFIYYLLKEHPEDRAEEGRRLFTEGKNRWET